MNNVASKIEQVGRGKSGPSTGAEAYHDELALTASGNILSEQGVFGVGEGKIANKKLANPLAGYPPEDLKRQGAQYARLNNMVDAEDIRAFEIGAVLAQEPGAFDDMMELTREERAILQKEISSRWSQPKALYLVVVLCSTCAALQGMGQSYRKSKWLSRLHELDETVVNGAQLFYTFQFGVQDSAWLTGVVNSAPYLCCAILGCWAAIPLNVSIHTLTTHIRLTLYRICGVEGVRSLRLVLGLPSPVFGKA